MLTVLIVVVFFAAPARAAEQSDRWKCTPQRFAECSVDGCREAKPTVWFEVDAGAATYKRCDTRGCDEYPAEVSRSGVFSVYELRGRAAAIKVSDLGMFVDVATAGVSAFVNSGTCSRLR